MFISDKNSDYLLGKHLKSTTTLTPDYVLHTYFYIYFAAVTQLTNHHLKIFAQNIFIKRF